MASSLSPRQLKEFMTGEKVFIFYGQDPNTRQRVFPSAVPKKILNHFSPYCKQKLENDKQSILCFGTGGSKDVLKFAIQWMCAGGWDVQRQMSTMDANSLIDLYRLALLLDVSTLQTETQRLLGPALHKSKLPQVLIIYKKSRDLELDVAQRKAEARLCYLLHETILDPQQMKFVYENTTEDSAVRTIAIKQLAAAVSRGGFDSSPYEDYCGENPKFNDDMIKASPPYCFHCEKIGHTQVQCYALYPDLIPVKQCTHCKQTGHLEPGCFLAHPELAPPDKVCQNCNKYGHSKDNCFKLFPDKAPPAKVSCAHCGKAYHTEEACWVLHPEIVPPPRRAATMNGRHQAQRGRNPTGRRTYNHNGSPVRTSTGTTASLADYFKLK
ncbi:MAG: hypothetical protein M1836_007449 [Candelina mexicana]|nr:MAG: hypothetical protein M1836_007449 [Candelina mexicana]